MAVGCTVIARFHLITCEFEDFLRTIRSVIPALKSRPGFLGAQLLAKEDQTEVATVTTWKDRDSYDSLQADPAVMEAGIELFQLLQSGAVDMQIEVYQTIEAI